LSRGVSIGFFQFEQQISKPTKQSKQQNKLKKQTSTQTHTHVPSSCR
jgi:hypothetical protein